MTAADPDDSVRHRGRRRRAYAGAQVISQVTSLKIGVVFDQSVDMGTFVYPITFTLRDVVHKVLGRHVGPHARSSRPPA